MIYLHDFDLGLCFKFQIDSFKCYNCKISSYFIKISNTLACCYICDTIIVCHNDDTVIPAKTILI
jgi:hypothetical protein